jgi:hypothetical protein
MFTILQRKYDEDLSIALILGMGPVQVEVVDRTKFQPELVKQITEVCCCYIALIVQD